MLYDVKNYQYKLDLGEGEGCHQAYEDYLAHHRLEDNNERWVAFTLAWNKFETVKAMIEKTGHPLQ
jgi:hypothetical protein